MTKRTSFVLLAVMVFAALAVAPAGAGPDKSPKATQFEELDCQNGIEADEVTAVGQGKAIHLTGDGINGVVKSFFLLDDGVEFEFFDVPGQGHDKNTTWCEWMLTTTAGPLYFGGEVLFQGSAR